MRAGQQEGESEGDWPSGPLASRMGCVYLRGPAGDHSRSRDSYSDILFSDRSC